MNLSLETIDQSLCYQFLTEYLKSWFIKDLLSLLMNIIYFIIFYYINTNEIPGEFSRENTIFTRVHVIFTRENITVAMPT